MNFPLETKKRVVGIVCCNGKKMLSTLPPQNNTNTPRHSNIPRQNSVTRSKPNLPSHKSRETKDTTLFNVHPSNLVLSNSLNVLHKIFDLLF